MGKLEEYKESAHSTRSRHPRNIPLTMVCWVLKGLEWYFLGLALGLTDLPFYGYFLIHPLVTALAFVPITPAGAGVQEFGIVGIFGPSCCLTKRRHFRRYRRIRVLARGMLIFARPHRRTPNRQIHKHSFFPAKNIPSKPRPLKLQRLPRQLFNVNVWRALLSYYIHMKSVLTFPALG